MVPNRAKDHIFIFSEILIDLTDSWLNTLTLLFHDGGPYHIETSPLICSANQLTGLYVVGTSVMKELINTFAFAILSIYPLFFVRVVLISAYQLTSYLFDQKIYITKLQHNGSAQLDQPMYNLCNEVSE